jgi:hypothetical protein
MTTPNESVQDDWAELRAAAELATPGPWMMERNLDIGNIYIRESKGHYGRICRIWNDRTATDENASYIALASPDRILALLAQRDDLAAELAAYRELARQIREMDHSFDFDGDGGESDTTLERIQSMLPAPPQTATEEKK